MTPQTGRRRTLWDKPLYPHFETSDAAAMVEKARKAGYRIVREPRNLILAPKHSLLILMVILGRLYL